MTAWGDFESEMRRLPIDPDTADRLLAGDVPREDAPPGYQEVVSLLTGLRADERCAGRQNDRDRCFEQHGARPSVAARRGAEDQQRHGQRQQQ